MRVENQEDVLRIIREDHWMMEILRAAKSLNLPDWWICAGFVRSKIWDVLHDFKNRTPLSDIDVVYFDGTNKDEGTEKRWEAQLKSLLPNVPWSVKNEARMHAVNQLPPYTSSADAISKFPETATALGVKLNDRDELILLAPHGLDDVLRLRVKPTPLFEKTPALAKVYEERLAKKNWKAIWPQLKIYHLGENRASSDRRL